MPSAKTKGGRIEKIPNKKTRSAIARRKVASKGVAIDNLAWKTVELPDTLEDAEGFYELEEIDDVEVIRDASGTIEFHVEVDNVVRENEPGSDWEGFSDAAEAPDLMEEEASEADDDAYPKEDEETLNSAPGQNPFSVLESQAEPEGVDASAWAKLSLSGDILSAVSRLGFTMPTPIQEASIPEILNGRDVIGKAPTGSGKTLAYGIPIVEHFLSKVPAEKRSSSDRTPEHFSPTALIISPTRELARQIERHLNELCSTLSKGPRLAMLTGGLSLMKQQRVITMADIVIGTPGRLWEMISSLPGMLKGLQSMKFLVMDEADRLLSDGHFKEVEQILESLERREVSSLTEHDAPAPHSQILVFSATFAPNLHQSLAGKSSSTKSDSLSYLLKKLPFHDPNGKPKLLDLNPANASQLAPRLRTAILSCDKMEKDLHLYALLLLQPAGTKTLIFVNSISAVRRLAPLLQYLNLNAHGLHSQMQQKARLKTLERFAASSRTATQAPSTTRGAILVATDIASRGLDIPEVQLVVHYHAPRAANTYIHRSGRTARAEASGSSVLLCASEEVVSVRRLIAKVHAQGPQSDGSGKQSLKQIELDRVMVNRLKSRVGKAQRIADAEMAGEKARHEDRWIKEAAEELGVDVDDGLDELEDRRGKKGRKKGGKNDVASTDEIREWKAELKQELSRRVNVGVSEKYLTAGGLDVDALLKGEPSDFLGSVMTVEMEVG